MSRGEIVATSELTDRQAVADEASWPVVLQHDRIPFVSYPYEWSFSQLQDAGALHIDLLLAALGEGMTMKDGYAYNLQFRGSAPVFIDIGSFEHYSGGPWAGYRQFCQTLLFPLLLQAHTNLAFRPLLRGQVNGIEPAQIRGLMGGTDLTKTGVLKHVACTTRWTPATPARATGRRRPPTSCEKSGFSDAGRGRRGQERRHPGAQAAVEAAGDSHWATYQQTSTYTDAERDQKTAFVREALSQRHSGLLLDLGCNDGTFSLVGQEFADYVVALDNDEQTIDLHVPTAAG